MTQDNRKQFVAQMEKNLQGSILHDLYLVLTKGTTI